MAVSVKFHSHSLADATAEDTPGLGAEAALQPRERVRIIASVCLSSGCRSAHGDPADQCSHGLELCGRGGASAGGQQLHGDSEEGGADRGSACCYHGADDVDCGVEFILAARFGGDGGHCLVLHSPHDAICLIWSIWITH